MLFIEDLFRRKNILEKNWNKKLDKELQRQILHHEITYKCCFNQLTICPILKANKILNLGSGYGIWSYFLSLEYPGKNVINIDNKHLKINVLEGEYSENINFLKVDLKKSYIPYINVDFIYQRDMISVYNRKEWINIIKEIYRCLNITGYAEFVEFNFIVEHNYIKDTIFSKITNEYLVDVFDKNDYIYKIEELIDTFNIYFKPFCVERIKLPLYGNDEFSIKCIDDFIISYSHIKEEIEKIYCGKFEDFIENIKKEWENNKSYIELCIICCQK